MTPDRFPVPACAPRRTGAATLAACALAIAALAGCASPSSRFYTLSPGNIAAPVVANPPWLIEVAPVEMPPQATRNQFVVQKDATRVDILEQERWASLPADEVRRALSGDLTGLLGAIDAYGAPRPEGMPVYRVSVNVQRFESWPGSHALIDAVWSVRSLRTRDVMTCRSVLNEPVGSGYDQLVDGHRRAVQALADSIASGIRTLAQAGAKTTDAAPCPSPSPTTTNSTSN
jgi:uncharacterized lipoprotein YmbA